MLISKKYLINLFIYSAFFLRNYFLPTLPSRYGIRFTSTQKHSTMKKSIRNRWIDVKFWGQRSNLDMGEKEERDGQMCSTGVHCVIASFSSKSNSICDSETDITWVRGSRRLSPPFKRLDTLNGCGQTCQQVISSKGKPVSSDMLGWNIHYTHPYFPTLFVHYVKSNVGCISWS